MQIHKFDFSIDLYLENSLFFLRKVTIDFTFIISAHHVRVGETMRVQKPPFHPLTMQNVMLCFEW